MPIVFIASFPAGAYQTNCYLVAAAEGGQAVVIDAGMDAAAGVRRGLDQYGLRLAGVLATHGHVDHIADAAQLADAAGVELWINPADRPLLSHPGLALNRDARTMLRQARMETLPEPRRVHEIDVTQAFEIGGVTFEPIAAPGHTPGSTLFALPGERVLFSGDVIFAGTIGRMDLPMGDTSTMQATLRRLVGELDPDLDVLPGHGPATTWGGELANNPYLSAQFLSADFLEDSI